MATSAALKKSATVAKVVAKFTGNIGDMIDQLHLIREKKRLLQAEIDAVEGEYKGVEEELMERLAAQTIDGAKGKLASCSISSSVIANVQDWDKLNAWIAKTKNFQLYQRRITDAAYREMLEMKGAVPGIESFVKKRLNVRTL
jgi:hypothetical protein